MNSESRSQKAVRNIIMGILSKIVVMVLGFVDRKVFISILGEELLGVNGLFTNVLLVLSLAELGLTNVMVFSYYKPLAEKDYDKLCSLTAFYGKVYNIIAVSVAVIGACLIPALKYIVNVEEPIENMVLIYLIYLANTVISYLFVYKSTILTADQNGYIVTSTQIRFDVFRQAAQIVFLLLTRNYIVYLVVKVLFALFNNLYLMRKVDKTYPFLDLKHAGPLDKAEKKQIATTVKSGFVYKISSVLLNGTSNIIISTFIGTVWVGYVSNYDTVITAISGVVAIIFTSMTASIGNLNVTAAPEKKKEIFDVIFFGGCWMALIVVPCCYFLMGDLITVWLGDKFVLSKGILASKLALLYFTCTLNPIFSFREALGLFRKSKYYILAGSLINIFLGIFMALHWGVAGVFSAAAIAMCSTYVWYEPIILYKEYFKSMPWQYFGKHIQIIINVLLIILIGSFLFDRINVDGWGTLFLKGIICFLTVVFMSVLSMCWRKEFKYVKQWIWDMLGGLRRR